MVAAESQFEVPEYDEIFLVSQRKYNLDASRPWWEKLFFWYLFLPFVRFAFKRMHVPAPGALEPCHLCANCLTGLDCSKPKVVLIEQQGVYFDEGVANERCEDQFWGVKTLPLNTDLPSASVQYKGHRAPKSLMPDRYRRRHFPGVAIGTPHQVKELTETLNTISRTATGQK